KVEVRSLSFSRDVFIAGKDFPIFTLLDGFAFQLRSITRSTVGDSREAVRFTDSISIKAGVLHRTIGAIDNWVLAVGNDAGSDAQRFPVFGNTFSICVDL